MKCTMQNWLKGSEKVVDKIVHLQQVVSNMFLLFMMGIITFDVLGRNIWNRPLKGTFEMTELGAALLVFFALAATHRLDEHITIDFLTEKCPRKVQQFLYGTIEVVITVLLFVMARQIFANGMRMMERKTTTTDLALPLHPFLFVITFTLVIFAFIALYKAIHHFRAVVMKR